MEEQKVMTLDEVAEFLDCSKPTVKKLINAGLPYFKVGSNYRFFLHEIVNYLKNNKPVKEEII